MSNKNFFRNIRPLTSPELAKEIKIIAARFGIKQYQVKPEHFKLLFEKPREEKFNFKL